MITVGYEQERGLRVKNQLCSGEFSTSASKNLRGSGIEGFQALERSPSSAACGFPIQRKSSSAKADDRQIDSDRLARRDAGRNQLHSQRRRQEPGRGFSIANSKTIQDVTRLKAYWSEALSKLNDFLVAASSGETRGTRQEEAGGKKKPSSKLLHSDLPALTVERVE